jgi:hypothetical protein
MKVFVLVINQNLYLGAGNYNVLLVNLVMLLDLIV